MPQKTTKGISLYREQRLIVSVFDYTGEWVKPYINAGYPVLLHDLKFEGDILDRFGSLLARIDEAIENGYYPYGLFSAAPCTDTAGCGARHWKKKDAPKAGYEPFACETELSESLFLITLHLRDLYPWAFWVLENPVGRVETLVPELKPYRKMSFNPCDYGDAYTKKTVLWGNFNINLEPNPVEPEYVIWAGKKFPKLFAGTGGKSEKTKTIRSTTPAGFAKAFFEANP